MNLSQPASRRFLILITLLLLPVVFAASSLRPGGREKNVHLLLTTRELEPGSAFELRFDQPVARYEDIGTEASPPPLVVDPPLHGRFVWKSRRSGIFAPTEPLRLSTRYRFSLRPGLVDDAGRRVTAALSREIQTPPLQGTLAPRGWWGGEHTTNARVLPGFTLVLNDRVRAADLADAAVFASGRKHIPARVTPFPRRTRPDDDSAFADGRDPDSDLRRLAENSDTWAERFHPKGTRVGLTDTNLAGVFFIEPERPLDPAPDWRLEIGRNLRSSDAGARLAESIVARVGGVQPFEPRRATARSTAAAGRWVQLEFSKQVAATLTNLPSAFVHVDPEPDNLEIEAGWAHLAVHGAFQLGKSYRISVQPGAPAAEPQVTTGLFTTNITFEPLPPAVWLKTFEADQLAAGRRGLELLAVNTPQTRLRVKRLDEASLIPALRAYGRYLGRRPEDPDDQAAAEALVYDAVPGRTVVDTNFPTKAEPDVQVVLRPGWNGLVGDTPGAFYLQADLHGVALRPATEDEPAVRRTGPESIVQLTDLGVVAKAGEDAAVVWVFSHRTGAAVEGVHASLRTDENAVLASAVTDLSGLARIPGTNSGPWLVLSKGDDIHAVRLSEAMVPSWPFRLPFGERKVRKIIAFTDREAYRPGEPVHLKAYVREWTNAHWAVPVERSLSLRWEGPREDAILSTNLDVSSTGSADVVSTPPTAARGRWTLHLQSGNAETALGIEVREFRPAAFEVNLGAKAEYGPAEPVRIPLGARYLFGDPITRGSVRWSLEPAVGVENDAWSKFTFFDDAVDWQLRRRDRIGRSPGEHGTVEIAGTNGVVLEPQCLMTNTVLRPMRFDLLAEVTDLNRQTISKRVEFVRHSSAFYLGFRWAGEREAVIGAGEAPAFQLVAVADDGGPAAPVEVRATLQRVEWRTVRVLGAGRSVDYRSEPDLIPVTDFKVRTAEAAKIGSEWCVADRGDAPRFAELKAPGNYLLTFRANDADGRPVETTLSFYVNSEGGRTAWNLRNGSQLELVPDRTNYVAGDVALLLAKAPFPGTALVTVEREGVRRAFVQTFSGDAPAIRVPIEPGDVPNVVIGVALVRGHEGNPHEFPMPEWRMGMVNLTVAGPEDRLGVEVKTDAGSYEPGRPVFTEALVRDSAGAPAPEAEVTLYAVDEGYLTLTGTAVPDPFAELHAPRPLTVATSVPLHVLFPENPELQSFENKGFAGGGGGRAALVRRRFEPCPLWSPRLMTDASGRVGATFTAPDSVTRYKIIAVAVRGPAQSGAGSAAMEIRKPLMIESAAPRFAHVGDRLDARAIVYNRTGDRANVRVSLSVGTNGVVPAPAVQEITLDPGAAGPVEIPVSFLAVGPSAWSWRAETTVSGKSYSDASEAPFTVSRAEPELHDAVVVRVDRGESNLLAHLDPRLADGPSDLLVRICNSPLIAVAEPAARLLTYPYGCAEQTASAMLPWLVLRDFADLLPSHSLNGTNAASSIAYGVQRLFSMQTASGGLAYWPGQSEPQVWVSAYGALVLALARDAGADVPAARLQRLQNWLTESWGGRPPVVAKRAGVQPDPVDDEDLALNGPDLHDRCLVALALAVSGSPNPALVEAMAAQRDLLDAEDRALLSLAISKGAGDPTLASGLLTSPKKRRGGPAMFASGERELAIRLLAAVSGADATADTLAAALVDRLRGGHFGNTQGDAWALWALADYGRAQSARQPVAGGFIAGGQTESFLLSKPASVASFKFHVPSGGLPGGARAVVESGGPVFASVIAGGRWETGIDASAPVARGFALRRTYAVLDEQNHPAPASVFHPGDRVLVSLELDAPEEAAWVAIEDPVPAPFEIIEGVFQTDASSAQRLIEAWTDDFREVRGDRILIFRNYLPEGRHAIRYLARVRSGGDAVAAPARVEAMYEPSRHGLSGGARIRSEAKP
jgi:alpha-2-macroglobulin